MQGVGPLLVAVGSGVTAVVSAVHPVAKSGGPNAGWYLGAIALAAAALVVRASRIDVTLGADAVVVRNLVRTYRLPYDDLDSVAESRYDPFFTRGALSFGSPCALVVTFDRSVRVEATAYLPATERAAFADALVRLAEDYEPPDDPDEVVDRRPPYDAVLGVLVDVRPDGRTDEYDFEAGELATLLRSRPLSPADVTGLWERLYAGEVPLRGPDVARELAERLSALR
jgi:hypothetical protein